MIFVTGDTHGQFNRIYDFCKKMNTTTDDVMIILGDVGFNYYFNGIDREKKKKANSQPITWFCIKGNHEKYAGKIKSYEEKELFEGIVYVEPQYPRILFAKDGEIYTFKVKNENKKVLVIGGAYSVDKYYRIAMGMKWFSDEQPCDETKEFVENNISDNGYKVDYVLSHTCPLRFLPIEWFMNDVNQESVDNSTEKWLDKIYDKLEFDKWYCGHFHGSKTIDKIKFVHEDYIELGR